MIRGINLSRFWEEFRLDSDLPLRAMATNFPDEFTSYSIPALLRATAINFGSAFQVLDLPYRTSMFHTSVVRLADASQYTKHPQRSRASGRTIQEAHHIYMPGRWWPNDPASYCLHEKQVAKDLYTISEQSECVSCSRIRASKPVMTLPLREIHRIGNDDGETYPPVGTTSQDWDTSGCIAIIGIRVP